MTDVGDVLKVLDEYVESTHATLVSENRCLHAKVKEYSRQVAELQLQLKDLPKLKEQSMIDARKELFDGFTIGQKVWYKYTETKRKTCGYCNGNRKVTATVNGNELEVECPGCKGIGVLSYYHHKPKQDEITYLRCEWWGVKEVTCSLRFVSRELYTSEVYKTEQECADAIAADVKT